MTASLSYTSHLVVTHAGSRLGLDTGTLVIFDCRPGGRADPHHPGTGAFGAARYAAAGLIDGLPAMVADETVILPRWRTVELPRAFHARYRAVRQAWLRAEAGETMAAGRRTVADARQSAEGADMYKVVWIARYPGGMSKQAASDYWAGHHGPTMKKVSPLAGYVQSHVQGPLPAVSGVAEEDTLFDGYSCAWWNSSADFQQAMTTPEWQRVVEDGPNVFDMDWLWNMSAHIEEVPVIEGPASPYKVVWIVRFKDGLTREEGREHWRRVHGPIFKKLDIDRYVQNHVVGPVGEAGEAGQAEIGFDGFSECWFRDESQFRNAVESGTWAVAVEDARNVFDMTQMWGAALRENVVVPPPPAGP